MNRVIYSLSAIVFAGITSTAIADSQEELAKQLANPIASLISLPIELTFDEGYGAAGTGSKTSIVAKPVIPFSVNDDWNIISRTIISYSYNDNITPGVSESGFGDTIQSFFFSPKAPTAGGLIWGVGPVFQIPTASSNAFGVNEWGAGLTALVLKQSGPWTIGALVNHVWDVGGSSADQSTSFLQPFVNYTTPNALTFALNTESTYDWISGEWTVPVNMKISKLVNIGDRPVSLSATARYWADTPAGGADGWGMTLGATFLFPK